MDSDPIACDVDLAVVAAAIGEPSPAAMLDGAGLVGATAQGRHRYHRPAGPDVEAARARRRGFARPCLDWTQRRPQLAGSLAAAATDRLLVLGWFARRAPGGRALRLTEAGADALDGLWGGGA